jgi:hypothetical protein
MRSFHRAAALGAGYATYREMQRRHGIGWGRENGKPFFTVYTNTVGDAKSQDRGTLYIFVNQSLFGTNMAFSESFNSCV